MFERVQQTIQRHRLIREGERVLVAVSGGADSVALAVVLRHLGVRMTLAHLDHGIRAEGAADAEYVTGLAAEWGTECRVGHVDVPALAMGSGRSLEMVAREERYRFLTATAEAVQATAIATGHTLDDQAETVLMKLARGAGAQGLSAMGYRSALGPFALIRPLRDCRRHEIETFLRERGRAWREDPSNRDDRFLRNRVRHEVLPLLEDRLNPSARDALVRTGDVLGDEDRLLQAMARRRLRGCLADDGVALELPALARLSPALRRRVIALWLGRAELLTFSRMKRIETLCETYDGSGVVPLAAGWVIERAYTRLTVRREGPDAPAISERVPIPGVVDIPAWGLRVRAEHAVGYHPATELECWLKAPVDGLMVRSWQPGDRMKPGGMDGSVKLQDVFVDREIPQPERARVPVFVCGDEVVWVPGYRVARGWEVPSMDAPSVQVQLLNETEGEIRGDRT